MSQLPLCPHCLEPVRSGYHGSCPNCGKSLENHNPEGALPLGTQLGGHYTVGEYQSADGDGLCYRGVDNDERRFVLIKEYFPVTLCNGRSPDGDLMPKEGREVLFKTSRMDFKDLYDDLHRITPATGLSQILDVMEENNTVYAVEETEKEILIGKTAGARGSMITGEMPNNGAVAAKISTVGGEYIVPLGYHDGSGRVAIDPTEAAKIIAGNIKAGVSILGVTGTYSGEAVTAQTKTVDPLTTAQAVLPDADYDYLSQVNVNAIYYNEADNAAGGKTVTIGKAAKS